MPIPRNSVIEDQLKSRNRVTNPRELPEVSTNLESIRTYQFEVNFQGFPGATAQQSVAGDLTVAAKQVGSITYGVESIAVNRLNDKVHYPGKATYEPVEITFDNLLLKDSTPALWRLFKEVYNPVTGKTAFRDGTGNSYKGAKMTIVEMNGDNVPVGGVELFGVYPEKVAFSEKNYGTNEFSTVTVTFRFDFLNYDRRVTGVPAGAHRAQNRRSLDNAPIGG
tara:strand:+ start:322 stop:987 length:666 start_codon:yes stop_codon:yes gene_type:complete